MKNIISITVMVTISLGSLLFTSTGHTAFEQELGTIVISASRIEQKQLELTGNVSVVTAEQIEKSSAQNVPEVLKNMLGVYLTDNSTSKSSVVDIRGFGDTAARNTLILINGRKVNAVDISAPDLIQVPLQSVERIEVVRGAGSVLYGDNAVGGVVNIITKKGEGDFKGESTIAVGSYDAHFVDTKVSGQWKDLSYFGYTKYNDARGYRENSDLLAKDYNARFGYKMGDFINTDVELGWHEDKQGLPGALSESELNSFGRRGSADPSDTSYTKDRYFKINLDVDPFNDDKEKGYFLVDYSYRNRDGYDEFNSFSNFHTKRQIDSHGITGKYVFDRTIFERKTSFVLGVDYYDTENDILGSGTNSDDLTITKEELGLYGFLQYEVLDNVFFNGGSRYQRADYNFDDRANSNTEQESLETWVSMLGAKYQYAKNSNLHWSIQQTFRFLATDEWYSSFSGTLNTNLEQQRGIQYEAGIKHSFEDKIIASITPYMIDLKHEIYFDPLNFSNSNYSDTRRFGVEVSGRFDILDLFNMESDWLNTFEYFASYNFQNPEFRDGPNDGNKIPMVPEHQAKTGFSIQFLDHLYYSLSGRYTGARFALNDVANAIDAVEPHFIWDMHISFKQKNLEVYASLKNLSNVQYSEYVSSGSGSKSYFPSPERNYEVGVKLKF